MDVHTADTRAASSGSIRMDNVEQYNEYLDSLNRDRAARLLRQKDSAVEDENSIMEENETDQIKGLVTATINVSTGKADAREALEQLGIKVPPSGAKAMVEAGEAVKDGHAVQGASSLEEAMEIAKSSGKLSVGKLLGKSMAHAGGAMNIGMAMWEVGHDYNQGEIVLHGNAEQKMSERLQMAAGVADVVGFAFAPAMVAGALLGVGSAVLGEIGDIEEEKKKVGDVKKATKQKLQQIQAEVVKPQLKTLAAEAPVRATTAKVYG